MNIKRIVIVGLGISLLISVLSPYLASTNPDGLESTAQKFEDVIGKEYHAIQSPFSDYLVPQFGDSKKSSMLALVLGTLITFGVGYIVVKVIRKRDFHANN
jgi:cobalt/nickel transport protein